jgi:molecular chaperone Hsp33
VAESDSAQRFMFESANIRGELVHLTESFATIMQQHRYPPFIQQFLGELLVAAVLLAGTIKFKGELTIQLETEGPIHLLVAKCTDAFTIRGLANWEKSVDPATLVDAFERGKLVITVQPKHKSNYYQSIVPLMHRGVSEAIEHYFQQSEQLLTKLWLYVDQGRAAGMLLQKMPGAEDAAMHTYWEHVLTLANTATRDELLALDNQRLLHRLYHAETLRMFDPRPVRFACTCTVQRMEGAILTLGEEEARLMLKKNKAIQVTCEFCNQVFAFDAVDVARIFAMQDKGSLH